MISAVSLKTSFSLHVWIEYSCHSLRAKSDNLRGFCVIGGFRGSDIDSWDAKSARKNNLCGLHFTSFALLGIDFASISGGPRGSKILSPTNKIGPVATQDAQKGFKEGSAKTV